MILAPAHPVLATEAAPAGAIAPPAIRAAGLCRRIGDRMVLRDVNLRIEPGEAVALVGANGAGKSTLLKVLATLATGVSGELDLFGRPVRGRAAAARARIGMIGHQLMLYRDLTALENLVFFGRLYGVPDVRQRAMTLLDFVSLADRAHDPVRALSRGMAQRVAIARSLMHDPDLLLTDEPFTGLDYLSARRLEDCLTDLHAGGRTIILATHDLEQGLRLAERMVVLCDGRITLDRPTDGLDADLVAAAMGGMGLEGGVA
jgi:heme exporter protein A